MFRLNTTTASLLYVLEEVNEFCYISTDIKSHTRHVEQPVKVVKNLSKPKIANLSICEQKD